MVSLHVGLMKTFFELDVGFLRPTQPQNMTLTDDGEILVYEDAV